MSLIELSWTAKKQFKVQIIGILETPIIDQKCTYEKVTNKLGRALPPPLDKIQNNSYFFRETFPDIINSIYKSQSTILMCMFFLIKSDVL